MDYGGVVLKTQLLNLNYSTTEKTLRSDALSANKPFCTILRGKTDLMIFITISAHTLFSLIRVEWRGCGRDVSNSCVSMTFATGKGS